MKRWDIILLVVVMTLTGAMVGWGLAMRDCIAVWETLPAECRKKGATVKKKKPVIHYKPEWDAKRKLARAKAKYKEAKENLRLIQEEMSRAQTTTKEQSRD